jgi:alpha-tubulin suppressor-like RCC1 family protein
VVGASGRGKKVAALVALAGLALGIAAVGSTSASAGTTTTTGVAGWGFDSRGQVGDGIPGFPGANVTAPVASGPGALAGENIVSVCAGYEHSVALTASHEVIAWGSNFFGQLGDGTNTDEHTPTLIPIALPAGQFFSAITCGDQDTLGLTDVGTIWAWGENFYGQLGDGSTVNSNVPHLVDFGNLPGLTAVSISAGESASAALLSNGSVAMWGRNDLGQLGRGTVYAPGTPDATEFFALPGLVDTPVQFSSITTGQHHALAITTTGQLYAWGDNSFGQLGDGSTTEADTPIIVDTSAITADGERITRVTAGNGHSLALTSGGHLWAWGRNGSGQLGTGTTTDTPLPAAVDMTSAGSALAGHLVAHVSAGEEFTLAVTTDGIAVAWGANQHGQLGSPSTDPGNQRSVLPTAVTATGTLAGKRVGLIAAGITHSLAVTQVFTPASPIIDQPTAGNAGPDAVFTGTGEPGATVTLFGPSGALSAPATVAVDGSFSIRPTALLALGTAMYSVRQSVPTYPDQTASVALTIVLPLTIVPPLAATGVDVAPQLPLGALAVVIVGAALLFASLRRRRG